MAEPRPAPRKTALYAFCLAGIVAGLALWAAPGRPAQVAAPAESVGLPDTLDFEVRYDGLGAAGDTMVWLARARGPSAGAATIRMEYAGDPAERRMPIWPVNTWIYFSADDYRHSFTAELSGSINWRTGDMRVAGLVGDGPRASTAVELRMRLERKGLDGSASVVFYRRVAWGGVRE